MRTDWAMTVSGPSPCMAQLQTMQAHTDSRVAAFQTGMSH
jgi:hypothetical protein